MFAAACWSEDGRGGGPSCNYTQLHYNYTLYAAPQHRKRWVFTPAPAVLQCCSAAVSRCPTCRSGAPSTQPPLQQPIRKRVWSIFLEVSFYPLQFNIPNVSLLAPRWWWCSNVLPGDNSRSFSDPYHLSPIQARFLISFKWCSFKLATSSCARWGNHRQRVSHLRHVTWLQLTCHVSRVTISVISCQLSSVTRNIFSESQMGNFPHHFTSFGFGQQRRSFEHFFNASHRDIFKKVFLADLIQ